MRETLRVTHILKENGLYKGMEFCKDNDRDFGTQAHEMARLWIKGTLDIKALDKGLKPYLEVFKKFYSENVKEVISNSVRLESRKYGYTGELDIFYINHRDKFAISDFKFSEVVQPAYKIQLAGYEILVKEVLGYRKIYRQIVLLNDKNYKIVLCKDERDISIFLSSLTLYNFKKEHNLL